MQTDQHLSFGPYRFSPQTGQLWRGKHEVSLTKKAIALLRYLVERAGQVVAKEELFQTVWTDSVVSDAALTSCVQELRQALHDNARKPRYLETVHRRGFRFIAPLNSTFPLVSGSRFQVSGAPAAVTPDPRETWNVKREPPVVGRDADLTLLYDRLARALNAERQLVFVTGEPGIGKTTLIEHFVIEVRSRKEFGVRSHEEFGGQKLPFSTPNFERPSTSRLWVGRGQCIEHYGAGEAYLPILEALGRLCREPDGTQLIALLQQHAPTWLVQMPALLSPEELDALQRKTAGVTRERMLRELAEALEVITAERPLVLVLEDLHWSDVSTLDLLSMLARRQEPARLLLIGTYRLVEVLTRDHPLKGIKQELQLHGQCDELALDFLSEAAVDEYLHARLHVAVTNQSPLRSLARLIHQRTDGNPLFMVNVTTDLIAQGAVTQDLASLRSLGELNIGIPANLRQLIAQQLARVSTDERTILEAASVAGAEFSAAAVAAGVEQSAEVVETHCDDLVRRELFLRPRGTSEWLDGTVAARYGFAHALYQEVLYEQLSTSRRIRLHRQIGEREEHAYGDRAREIATELALHFERGRDYQRAVTYCQHSGENARQRHAYQEAASHFARGLELLKHWPETTERLQHEVTLRAALGSALVITKGLGAPEVRSVYDRARALCKQIGDMSQLFPVLFGLSAYYIQQEEMQITRELAEEYLALAEKQQDSAFIVAGCRLMVNATYWRGQFVAAHECCERAMNTGYNPLDHRAFALAYGFDPFMTCLGVGAWALWYLGYPDQALHRSQLALLLARELAHPYALAWMLNAASWVHFYRREGQIAVALADEAIALSQQHGFPHWLAMGKWMRGQALIEYGQEEEGVSQLQEGLQAYRATGALIGTQGCGPAEVARGYGRQAQSGEGLRIITEVLSGLNQVRHYEAEVYRLKGELTLQKGARDWGLRASSSSPQAPSLKPLVPKVVAEEAEEYFLKAIEIARTQHAKSLELRAVMSLVRLRQQQALEQRAKSKRARARSGEQDSRTTQHESRTQLAEAHSMLSTVYHWFTEGFDTKDLQEAKTLLDKLKQ